MANELRNLFGEGACVCDAVGRHTAEEHNKNLARSKNTMSEETAQALIKVLQAHTHAMERLSVAIRNMPHTVKMRP